MGLENNVLDLTVIIEGKTSDNSLSNGFLFFVMHLPEVLGAIRTMSIATWEAIYHSDLTWVISVHSKQVLQPSE